jgi:L-glyceraldehyde 3-phosphate reductase
VEQTGLLDAIEEVGAGCIGFGPLAQGLLTDRYLDGVPEGSRASRDSTLPRQAISEPLVARVAALNAIAERRGQSLAQMALAWSLRDPRVTSTLMGASSAAQLEANVAALEHPEFATSELQEIDGLTVRRR